MPTHRYTIGLYALYMLYYFIAEFLINDLTPLVFGSGHVSMVITVYWLGITCVAAGLASFYFFNRLVKARRRRKLLLQAVCLLNIPLLFALILVKQPACYLTAVLGFMLTAGYTGGAVHYAVAIRARDKQYSGRIVGVAVAAAVITQFLLQAAGKFSGHPFLWQAGTSSLALTGSLYILFTRMERQVLFDEYIAEETARQNPPPGYKSALVFIVILLTFMHGINDGILVRLHAEATIDLTDSPRWFYVAGMLLTGWLADYRQRRYLAITTLLGMMGCIISILFLSSVQSYWISASATYFFSAFMVMFLTVVFLDLAPRTGQPALWASMGRILLFIFTGLGSVAGDWIWRVLSLHAIITVYTIILMLLLALVFHIRFLEEDVQTAATPEKPAERSITVYSTLYALTPRETQVMELILKGLPIKEMAATLGITERTIKDHVAHILSKTETKNQKELLILLHKEE